MLALKYTVPVQVPAENAGLRKCECFRACGHLFSLHWSVPLMCMGQLIPRSSAALQNFTPYAPVKNVLKPHSGNNFFIFIFSSKKRACLTICYEKHPQDLVAHPFHSGWFHVQNSLWPCTMSKISCTFNPPKRQQQCITWAKFVQSSDSLKKLVFQLLLEDIVQIWVTF